MSRVKFAIIELIELVLGIESVLSIDITKPKEGDIYQI